MVLLVRLNSESVWLVGGVLCRFSLVSLCWMWVIGISIRVMCVFGFRVNLLMFFGMIVSVMFGVSGMLWY